MTRSGIIRAIATSSIFLLAAAGCASKGNVDNVRSDAEEARRIAEDADAKATLAAADAAAARTAAESAAKNAEEANAKADRIFQRSLRK